MDRKIQLYERDNSRLTSGMKETVTKNKVKHQVLLHTIEGLHNKFLMENENEKISYTSFSRLRSFWVLQPKESCDTKNLDCMYGRCPACKDIEVPREDVDQTREVTWLKWQTVKENKNG